MTKILNIKSCIDHESHWTSGGVLQCPNLKYNKYTKPHAYCAEMSPDKLIDVDFYKYLPSWCPLPDKPKDSK